MSRPLHVNERLTIPGSDLEWSATRASGPGGQNVNKVSSKVELHFDFEASPLLDAMTKSRLRVLGKSQLDAAGRLRIASQLTRDQGRNLEDARAKLSALILRALERPKSRRPTKPSRRAVARRLDAKGHNSAKKRDRRVDET
jgi:ribosome-associated protein